LADCAGNGKRDFAPVKSAFDTSEENVISRGTDYDDDATPAQYRRYHQLRQQQLLEDRLRQIARLESHVAAGRLNSQRWPLLWQKLLVSRRVRAVVFT